MRSWRIPLSGSVFLLLLVMSAAHPARDVIGHEPTAIAQPDAVVLRGDSTTHFKNDPRYINPDPNYVPGDYPLAEVGNARAVYHFKKAELAQAALEENTAVSLDVGEIKFTSIKDATIPVEGYFRSYFGVIRFERRTISSVEMVIDINSLDTAVPGRNNRILNVFFESMRPELGTAELRFTSIELENGSLSDLRDGASVTARASGTITMNDVARDLRANIRIGRQRNTWVVESAQPIMLLISDFGFGGRVAELMKVCNHRSVGNAVNVHVKLYFR
jgi:polyisoprenoid-binding protein YceI